MTNNNVDYTVQLGLCVSCGICTAICPSDAVELRFSKGQYLPNINDRCTDCGLCLRACPGYEVNFEELCNYENSCLPENIYLGSVFSSYICHANDEVIRKNASSGGMITALITELIAEKHFEGACVLSHDAAGNSLAKIEYLTDLEDIKAAGRSKYLPASVENAARLIEQRCKGIIIVGTPCQIHGIKKYCFEKAINYSEVLFLGLFCEKTLNYNFISFYQWKYGKGRTLKQLYYRNKEKDGWPGHTKLTFTDGTEIFVDRTVRMNLKNYFQLQRCLYCVDKFNQLADISFGDCYIKGEESELGNSNILVRTEKGKRVLDSVRDKFYLKDVDPLLITDSQKILQKQQNLNYCRLIERDHGHEIYPGVKSNTLKFSDYKEIDKSHSKALDQINMGSSANNFAQIDQFIRREKERNIFQKVINRVANKVGASI